MEQIKTTDRTISRETGSIITAIESLLDSSEKTITALYTLYGDGLTEGEGDSKYHSSGLSALYDTIKGKLFDLLSETMEGNLTKLNCKEV